LVSFLFSHWLLWVHCCLSSIILASNVFSFWSLPLLSFNRLDEPAVCTTVVL
jgi:hypothetical protein